LIIYLYVLKIKNKKLTSFEKSIKILKNIDFKSTHYKNIAYTFTLEGKSTLDDKNKAIFYNLLKRLEKYKYQKEILKIDNDLLDDMKQYVRDTI